MAVAEEVLAHCELCDWEQFLADRGRQAEEVLVLAGEGQADSVEETEEVKGCT